MKRFLETLDEGICFDFCKKEREFRERMLGGEKLRMCACEEGSFKWVFVIPLIRVIVFRCVCFSVFFGKQ